MTPAKLFVVKAECNELLARIRKLEEVVRAEEDRDKWIAAALKEGKFQHEWQAIEAYHKLPSSQVARSAIRRQSMELTRALAEMRKP